MVDVEDRRGAVLAADEEETARLVALEEDRSTP